MKQEDKIYLDKIYFQEALTPLYVQGPVLKDYKYLLYSSLVGRGSQIAHVKL